MSSDKEMYLKTEGSYDQEFCCVLPVSIVNYACMGNNLKIVTRIETVMRY